MENELDLKEYRRCYYLHNREKLVEYSKSYYKFKKGEYDVENENMKKFLSRYKKQKIKSNDKVKIKKGDIILKF
jgi:biotin-(acetyl-CoA carboxylase) ligase